jgi:hypothetical protein
VEAVNELDMHKEDFVGHVICVHMEHVDDTEFGSKRSVISGRTLTMLVHIYGVVDRLIVTSRLLVRKSPEMIVHSDQISNTTLISVSHSGVIEHLATRRSNCSSSLGFLSLSLG